MESVQWETLSIEDDVVVKNSPNKKRTCFHCRLIHVFIAVIFVLFVVVTVGVMTYFLAKPKYPIQDTIATTIQPGDVHHVVTDESDTVTVNLLDAVTDEYASEWSSEVDIGEDGWSGRLPLSVFPVHYNLSITPYLYQENVPIGRDNFKFDGNVSITIQCKERTSEIILHISRINISALSVFNAGGIGFDLTEAYEEDTNFEFLNITLTEELMVDSMYQINIDYEGIISDEPLGFYKISYTDEDGGTRWGAVTTMEPVYARRLTPCFDEPIYKAEFDVTIRHRSDMSALSNGIELRNTDLEGDMTGWQQTVFKTTPKMSTYLLAVAVTHFVSMNKTTESGTLIRVWSKPQDIRHASYALEYAVKQTTFYESHFNYTYPLEKQDMVAVPRFYALAMENWGLIIYLESSMIYNPEKDSLNQKKLVASVISHELAHQWFGNLVTPEWWNDLWLNEAFAQYTVYLGVDYCEPGWNMKDELFWSDNMYTMRLDSGVSTRSIRQQANTPDEIFELFDAITYDKGATVIRMLEDILSEEIFMTGLRNYLRVHAYANANTDDLWQSLTKADVDHGGNNVSVIMDTWTLQPGYPLVTFNRTTDTLVNVSQTMFLRDNETKEKFRDERYTWEILISHTHESDMNYESPTKDWVHRKEIAELTLSAGVQPTDWYLVNIGRHGYYVVNYDSTNWHRLNEQLLQRHEAIPVQNRFQLLYDAMMLFDANILDVNILFNLTLYLNQETEYIPWKVASLIGIDVYRLVTLQPSYGLYQKYWQQQISPIYKQLGWVSNELETPKTEFHRLLMIKTACLFEDEDCLQMAKNLYAKFMADPTNNTISKKSDMRQFVYCYGIMQGGLQEWEFGLEQYLQLSPAEREEEYDWLYALSCTTLPSQLNRLLEDAYNGLYEYGAFNALVSYILKRVVGLPVVWDYVERHWDEMFADYTNDVIFGQLLDAFGKAMFTDAHLQQLVEFSKNRDFGSYVDESYEEAIKKVKRNIEQRARYSEDVSRWLSEHVLNKQ